MFTQSGDISRQGNSHQFSWVRHLSRSQTFVRNWESSPSTSHDSRRTKMNKEEMMRQALDDMFKPDERQTEKLSHLLDKMTGNLTTQERVDRFKTLLKELRNESKEIQRILMEEKPVGLAPLELRSSICWRTRMSSSQTVRMFLPSRPMIRPFISSFGSCTTEIVVSDT